MGRVTRSSLKAAGLGLDTPKTPKSQTIDSFLVKTRSRRLQGRKSSFGSESKIQPTSSCSTPSPKNDFQRKIPGKPTKNYPSPITDRYTDTQMEQVLRMMFDLDQTLGPSRGIQRSERAARARKFGIPIPPVIEEILEYASNSHKSHFEKCLWDSPPTLN